MISLVSLFILCPPFDASYSSNSSINEEESTFFNSEFVEIESNRELYLLFLLFLRQRKTTIAMTTSPAATALNIIMMGVLL